MAEEYVTLERYKTDLACYKAKSDFILAKVNSYIAAESFHFGLTEKAFIDNLVDWLSTPAGMFISDYEWKKAGR